MSELVRTEDGSVTRFNQATGELYHNRAGAYTEALRNYFEPSDALARFKQTGKLSLLDACFGMGYNTFVLLQELIASGCSGTVEIVGIEIDEEILRTIPDVLGDPRFQQLRDSFNAAIPDRFGCFVIQCSKLRFSLDIRQIDLRHFVKDLDQKFDLIFHDPFSARKVPELWTVDVFRQYYRALDVRRGRVLTYASAAAVRGGLLEAGFRVYRTTAVGGKNGGTLALAGDDNPLSSCVFALSEEEIKRLQSRSGVPYRDLQFMQHSGDILRAREVEQESR